MSELKVTVTVPVETHEVPREKFSLKALGIDVPENASRGFLLTKNGKDHLIILGVDVCNRLTFDHDICIAGEPVTPGWGYGVDVSITRTGAFDTVADGLNYVRVKPYPSPNATQMKYIRSEIQAALLAKGLFKIEVEEIVPEADYSSHPAFTQSEYDDDDGDDDKYDDDEPF